MPIAVCDGIATNYEVVGDGPPLLMFSPGGFDATIENWRTFSIYRRLRFLDHLPAAFSCIVFDKRESGESGGRVQRLTWDAYAAQASALLDHLGVERAHVLGGCIGCTIAATLVARQPERVERIVLYSPAGGPEYRRTQLGRLAEHAAYVSEHGLGGVVGLARETQSTFAQDPRIGPWASVIRRDPAFADEYARHDLDEYRTLVEETASALFTGDDVPGGPFAASAPALVVPGGDGNHPPQVARSLAASLAEAELWDVPAEEQTEENAPVRITQFLSSDSPRSSAAI